MKVLHVGISSIALASLVGCGAMGLGNKRIDYGTAAAQVPTLEVPPDLTAPEADDRYKVPGAEGIASYSDYNRAAAPARVASSSVLPAVKGVSLERNGAQRWLKVEAQADQVWPVVKSFLHETGLNIQSEDQAAGVIETEWAENRAKIPQGTIRSVIGKVFDGMYSSGERDQYRIRLERGKDGVSTEVYVTHRGKEEVLDADKNSSKWQSRPNDPELEAELLQRLMVRFGGTPVQAAVAANPAEAVPATTGAVSLLPIFDGSSVIVINDPFDKSWRRVGLAIERAGYAVEDKDRNKGVYFLHTVQVEKGWLDKLKFWNSDEGADQRYRVNVKDGGVSCEISVTDQDGVNSDASKQRLEAIYKNLAQ